MGFAETNSRRMLVRRRPPSRRRDGRRLGAPRRGRVGEPPGRQGHVEEARARPPRRRPATRPVAGGVGAGGRRSPRRSRAAAGAAAFASAMASGLARSPISGWAGGASGTAGGSMPSASAAAAATAERIDSRRGASGTAAELIEPSSRCSLVAPSRSPAAAATTTRRPPRRPPPTALTVPRYDGEQLVRTTELACTADDVGLRPGRRPAPAACGPMRDEVCTPDLRRARSGTSSRAPWRASRCSIEVTRANGCEIARYDLLDEGPRRGLIA